jgi:tripartite-type tricarboxylate transporter receptor subunit TctC
VAPAGTPATIIEKLRTEIAAVQNSAETQRQFVNEGAAVIQMTLPQFAAFMQGELDKWGRVVKAGNIKAE